MLLHSFRETAWSAPRGISIVSYIKLYDGVYVVCEFSGLEHLDAVSRAGTCGISSRGLFIVALARYSGARKLHTMLFAHGFRDVSVPGAPS